MEFEKKHKLQKWILAAFRWFCHPDLVDSIEGDLKELYQEQFKSRGKFKASFSLLLEVLNLIRPSMIRSFEGTRLSGLYDFSSHLKMASRVLRKKKEYTMINGLGLAIGIAGFLLIVLYVKNEYSYDNFLDQKESIHKVVLTRTYPDRTTVRANIPHSFSNVFVADLPEVIRSTSLSGPYDKMPFSIERETQKKEQYLETVVLADSNFFKVFSFKMLRGDRSTALNDPLNMVLTERTAKKYFGSEDPMGKTITTSGRDHFIVTGICEDPPSNSHFKFGVLSSIQSIQRFNRVNFTRPDVMCYVQLSADANAEYLESKMPAIVDSHISSQIKELNQMTWEEYQAAGNGFQFTLCPLTEVYLDANDLGGMNAGGNGTNVRVMLVVAFLILFLACINFVNLSTARSSERAMEVGVRKIMGSTKTTLIMQFLSESILLSFFANTAACLLVWLALPSFNVLMNTDIGLELNLEFAVVFIGFALLLGVVAGMYSALIMSGFRPIGIVSGGRNFSKGIRLRNVLVVFQFWVSGILIIVLLVVQQQVNFMDNKSLGFEQENLIVIEGVFQRDPGQAYLFIDQLRQMSSISSVGSAITFPPVGGTFTHDYKMNSFSDVRKVQTMFIGDQFMETMEFQMTAGHSFERGGNDSLSVILNESAVSSFGISDPIGKKIFFVEQTYGSGVSTEFNIVGVVKDFNIEPLRQQIRPLVMKSTEIYYNRMRYIVCRVNPSFATEDLLKIQALWESMTNKPFQYRFVDQVLDLQYKKEQLMLKLFSFFSGLSIFIACMGLYGLSSFAAYQRTKEIGIRKIVGASAWSIMGLLGWDFTKRVLYSFLLAMPMAWYLVQHWWLNTFAYRIEIGIGVFIVSGSFALLVTWVTVSFHSLKAARLNPVKMLRSE